jgi:tripartite-type tricarboxylate transporter receptor subunit TctC
LALKNGVEEYVKIDGDGKLTKSISVRKGAIKPETVKKMSDESATVAYQGSEAFAKFMETESIKWAHLVKQLKLQAE